MWAATVWMLRAAGARMLAVDLIEEAGRALADELGGKVRFVGADVVPVEQARLAVSSALEGFGVLQGLVNCAGVVVAEKVVGKDVPHSLAFFAPTINVNLLGTFNMVKPCCRDDRPGVSQRAPGERGAVINTAFVAAFDGQFG